MKRTALLLAALFLIASMSSAQGERNSVNKSAKPPAKERLVKALSTLNEKGGFVLEGGVTTKAAADGGGGAVNAMIVVSGMGVGGKEFEGPIKAWRTTNDELVVISADRLPGFAFYDDGDRTVTRTYFEESAVNVARTTGELTGILDTANLLRYLKKADFDAFTDQESKTTTLQGILSNRLVKTGADSGIQIMQERVLRVEAEFVLDSRDRLVSFGITVVRTDPAAGLKRKVMSGEVESGILEGLPEASDEEGKSSVYTFRLASDKPSKEAKDFLKEVRAILEEEDF